MTEEFRACAIIPSHNHWRTIGPIVQALRAHDLPVFIVDDGSDEVTRDYLAALHQPSEEVRLRRFETNGGKGFAVKQGLRMAIAAGFTHAVQVDADGQHDITALPQLLAQARRYPQALITGTPVYDDSVPVGRAIGRWITHVWVWIETLSFRIADTMCGFRVYPLKAISRLLDSGEKIGNRMDFDIEIVVRLFWRGTPIVAMPVHVIYPPGNVSNFRLVKDNIRISAMHTRLVLSMLCRLPWILANRPPVLEPSRHWPRMAERGMYFGLRFLAGAYNLLGRRACILIMSPVVFYFYLTGSEQRKASRAFLRRAFAAKGEARAPTFWDGYRHFRDFAGRALDTFIGWVDGMPTGSLMRSESSALREAETDKRGALFIVAHVGNAELSRALIDEATRERLVVLVHTRHAENYNRLLREFRPAAAVNTFQVTELGPETAITLRERVEKGDWVVIAGDRTPLSNRGRVSSVPFLGSPAPFSQGPYILAALLECPVYTLFCIREGAQHRVYVEKFADKIDLPRQGREAALASYAAQFARKLEAYALLDPFQWYNFFDFWAEREGAKTT